MPHQEREPAGVLAVWWRRHLPWYPGDWLWPALLLLAVAAAATAVSAATSSGPGTTTVVATEPGVTVHTGTVPAPGRTRPAVTTGPLPQAPGTVPAPSPVPGLAPWPSVATAYTDVLASVPLASGRAAAVATARRAEAAGLPRVGVLLSTRHPSLRAGYYVAFSGVYRTPAAALDALDAAHARGFAGAYVARVTRP